MLKKFKVFKRKLKYILDIIKWVRQTDLELIDGGRDREVAIRRLPNGELIAVMVSYPPKLDSKVYLADEMGLVWRLIK